MASNTTDKDTSVNISISHPGAKNMSFKPTFVNPAALTLSVIDCMINAAEVLKYGLECFDVS